MFNTIRNYCYNGQNNGLLLLDMPTGSGKTYNVLNYIFEESIKEENKSKKFFFITTLKKNLPIKELEERFKNAGLLTYFKEKCLFIDSNADNVLETFTDELERDIPYKIKKTEEFKAFKSDITFLQNQKDPELREYLAKIRENLSRRTEPEFRKYIQRLLQSEFPTIQERLNALKTNQDWKWLGVLYPTAFTRDKQIFFLSMDKFLVRNTTLVEPSYLFYNNDILNDAVIFIDEFDATKSTLLDNIIQNGLKDIIDYIELFKQIYSALEISEFPALMTTPSQHRAQREYKEKSLEDVIEKLKSIAKEIYEEYHLRYVHRTKTGLSEEKANFLFQDHQYHTILADQNKKYIVTSCNEAEKVNHITFTKEISKEAENSIYVMLGKLRGFINYFLGAVNILAINYRQCKLERRKVGEDEFSFEAALKTILSSFNLEEKYIDFLVMQALMSTTKSKTGSNLNKYDLSFYENGFRYYAFEDDLSHDLTSKIMMYSFQLTPEKLLLKFCDKAKVVGISATATIDTVIGNYDLEYIRARLGELYNVPSEDDKVRMKEEFALSTAHYEKVKICPELIGLKDGEEYNENSWYSVFSSKSYAQKFFEKLGDELGVISKNTYHEERYLRIALAYKKFIENEEIRSFLCVLTAFPKNNNPQLDKQTLYEIFKAIRKEHRIAKDNVEILNGEEYENAKQNIQRRLTAGEKLFVISTYPTIGAGQNIQYAPSSVDWEEQLVKINDFDSRGEKDFEANYLDRPTNLISNLGENISEEDFIKALFQYEFLQEVAELSPVDTLKMVKAAFRCLTSHKTQYPSGVKVHNKRSVFQMSTRFVIQAIGRLCRTNLKRQKIYIYADRGIAQSMSLDVGDRLLNPEFKALLLEIEKNQSQRNNVVVSSEENLAALTSIRVNKYINNLLKEQWSKERIKQWGELRDLVLRSPTASQADKEKDFKIHNFYIKIPNNATTYYYNQEGDFNNVDISFCRSEKHPYRVSSKDAKLEALLKIPYIEEYFQSRGIATTFDKNEYIMSPPLFNNIYKGALGERVGRLLFYKILKVDLEEIEDETLFELFDFKVKGKNAYIDFKHWHESTIFDDSEKLREIAIKAKKCNTKKVFIVNILSERKYKICNKMVDDVSIIEIPYLFIEENEYTIDDYVFEYIRREINNAEDSYQ